MAKRRLGLLKINGGCDDSNRRGDIIFVHGLGDHPITAWYPNPEEIRDKVDTEQFWNQELQELNFWLNWLGKHRPDLGIWSYGYEAMPFKESSGLSRVPIVKGKIESYTGKASPIIDQASELLALLTQRDFLIRPKIFVTHSLGGLIVKETLYLAHDDLNSNDEMREIIGQTKGVVFCATPHQGSDLANFKELLAQVAKTFRLLDENVIISELSSENTNTQLYKSGKWYSGNTKTYDIQTKAFYETEETEIPAIGKRLVVDRFSSDPNVIGVRPTAVNGADHFAIVKPQSENDTIYIGVREFIDKYLPRQNSGGGFNPNQVTFEEEEKDGFFLRN